MCRVFAKDIPIFVLAVNQSALIWTRTIVEPLCVVLRACLFETTSFLTCSNVDREIDFALHDLIDRFFFLSVN